MVKHSDLAETIITRVDFVSMDDAYEYAAYDVESWDMDDVQSDTGAEIPDTSPDFFPLREQPSVARSIRESNSHWQHMPVEVEIAPTGGAPLATLTDDELMAAPVGLAIHLMQTAANGGLQVIAPQQIPLVDTMVRTNAPRHMRDMHITGSVASANLIWPLISGHVDDTLFPRIPIDGGPDAVAVRRKTRTTPLAPPSSLISDPVIKAFVLARALIDLQGRADVGGDARAVSDVIAHAWGVAPETMRDLADVSLAPTGSLLRYAARADQVMPRIHGPINELLCISTGTHATGRLVYGEHAAIDWRRARVMAEATFYLAARTEGYTMLDMKLHARPGDPRAMPNRPGVIQMRPKPGVVWCAAPDTFRLYPIRPASGDDVAVIPPHVAAALTEYDNEMRPVRIAVQFNAQVSYATSVVRSVAPATAAEVVRGYDILVSSHSTTLARGHNAHRMVRSLVYNALASADSARRIHLREMAAHLGPGAAASGVVLTPAVYLHMASMFVSVSSVIRAGIAVEASARRATLDSWWNDFRSSLPSELAPEKESTRAWGAGAFWYMTNPPSDKWRALMTALQHSQLRDMTQTTMAVANLPRVRGSDARVLAACKARVECTARLFSERYMAMSSVADILADLCGDRGQKQMMRRVRVAGAFWRVRAAAMSNLHLAPPTDDAPVTIQIGGAIYMLRTTYGREWSGLCAAVGADRSVSAAARLLFSNTAGLSAVLSSAPVPLSAAVPGGQDRLFRYSRVPRRLELDIRTALLEVAEDVMQTRETFLAEGRNELPEVVGSADAGDADIAIMLQNLVADREPVPGQLSYWDALEQMGALKESFDDTAQMLPDAQAEQVFGRTYASVEELQALVQHYVTIQAELVEAAVDAVV